MIRFLFRAFKLTLLTVNSKITTILTHFKFFLTGVKCGGGLTSRGVPILDISLKASFIIGNNLELNNGKYYNNIGRVQSCCFSVGNGGKLVIGNSVGISSSTIVCKNSVEVQDQVYIGANCVIYDTDFH